MKCRIVRYDGKHYCHAHHVILGSYRELEAHMAEEQ